MDYNELIKLQKIEIIDLLWELHVSACIILQNFMKFHCCLGYLQTFIHKRDLFAQLQIVFLDTCFWLLSRKVSCYQPDYFTQTFAKLTASLLPKPGLYVLLIVWYGCPEKSISNQSTTVLNNQQSTTIFSQWGLLSNYFVIYLYYDNFSHP